VARECSVAVPEAVGPAGDGLLGGTGRSRCPARLARSWVCPVWLSHCAAMGSTPSQALVRGVARVQLERASHVPPPSQDLPFGVSASVRCRERWAGSSVLGSSTGQRSTADTVVVPPPTGLPFRRPRGGGRYRSGGTPGEARHSYFVQITVALPEVRVERT
jgi:hypothetical protein